MSNVTPSASAVVIVETAAEIVSLPDNPTAILGIVGVTERGDFGGVLTTSFEEYVKKFGGFTANANAAVAAMGFFLEGGSTAWIVRTVHYVDVTNPASKTSVAAQQNLTTTGAATQGSVTSGNAEPFVLEAGDTILTKVDGAGAVTSTFNATQASRIGVAGTYPTLFGGGETLEVAIDNGVTQVIAFAVGDQTLQNVINKVNHAIFGAAAEDSGSELAIISDKQGTASKVEVVGGTGAATLGMAVGFTSGGGNVANIRAVTSLEVKTIVELATTAEVVVETGGEFSIKTPTVGAGGSIQVDAASTADDAAKCDLDNILHSGTAAGPGTMGVAYAKTDGTWANNWVVRIAAASNGQATYFDLIVVDSDGYEKERFPSLSTIVANADYWLTRLHDTNAGSIYCRFTDSLTGIPPANRPTNGDYTLAGGSDGLAGIADADFVGSATGPTGMYCLNKVENLTLLIIPGKATSTIHNAMLTYCETTRKKQVFAILDPPAGSSYTAIVTYAIATSAIKGSSDCGALYWPQIKISNPPGSPFTSDADGNIVVAPSGFIAGVFAASDKTPIGVYQPPAGMEHGRIRSCRGYETDEVLDETKRGYVYENFINPISNIGGLRCIDGNKTLKPSADFGTIGQRRGASYIETTLRDGCAFARHLNITKALRRRLEKTGGLFLIQQMKRGAFATMDPSTAFFINVSDALNPPSVAAQKIVQMRVGLAFAEPADWLVIFIGKDTRALDAELAEAGIGL